MFADDMLSWLKQRKTCSVCLVHFTPGEYPGDFTLTPAKQKLFILDINPSLGPLSILNVAPQKLEVASSYKYLGVWLDEQTTKTVLMHLVNLPEKLWAFL